MAAPHGEELCDWTAAVSSEQEESVETGGGRRRRQVCVCVCSRLSSRRLEASASAGTFHFSSTSNASDWYLFELNPIRTRPEFLYPLANPPMVEEPNRSEEEAPPCGHMMSSQVQRWFRFHSRFGFRHQVSSSNKTPTWCHSDQRRKMGRRTPLITLSLYWLTWERHLILFRYQMSFLAFKNSRGLVPSHWRALLHKVWTLEGAGFVSGRQTTKSSSCRPTATLLKHRRRRVAVDTRVTFQHFGVSR